MKKESIAIVGIGCRLPGGMNDPGKVWEKLTQGFDAIVDVPLERWDNKLFYHPDRKKPGKVYTQKGGFLNCDITQSDPTFFSISSKEAKYLDPQQLLLLEVAWEAMEDGGIVPEKIEGSNTGVFIASFNLDRLLINSDPFNHTFIDGHSSESMVATMLSARLSHTFDFKGPCISLDTACSSSLVTIHYACQSIWNGECEMALAGGAHLMLCPYYGFTMCKGGFLSEENQCRSFDADATGYVRGEGAGILFLKSYSQAVKDQNPIYALIRGTGINHNGRSRSLPVPSKVAQSELIKKTLSSAGVLPEQIQLIEAQGTGSRVADPIEAEALYEGLGKREGKTYLGSIKSNIGHLESAAGIASVIKAALSIKNQKIVPSIHFDTPNPEIPFEKYGFVVPRELTGFPKPDEKLFALVNSFGYSGTNAHLILEEAPKKESTKKKRASGTSLPFTISAKNKQALVEKVEQLIQFLKKEKWDYQDLSYTLLARAAHLEQRLFFLAENEKQVLEKLESFLQGKENGWTTGRVLPKKNRKIVFVYPASGASKSQGAAPDQLAAWGIKPEKLITRETAETKTGVLRSAVSYSCAQDFVSAFPGKISLEKTQDDQLVQLTGDFEILELLKRELTQNGTQAELEEKGAISQAIDEAAGIFVQIGSCAETKAAISTCLAAKKAEGVVISLDHDTFATLGQLYAAGVQIDWSQFVLAGSNFISLPHYPWQRKRHWIESKYFRFWLSGIQDAPLLKREIPLPDPCWETEISEILFPWIQGASQVPKSLFIEAAFQAQRKVFGQASFALCDLQFPHELLLNSREQPHLHIQLSKEEKRVKVFSKMRKSDEYEWKLHFSGKFLEENQEPQTLDLNPEEYPESLKREGLSERIFFTATKFLVQLKAPEKKEKEYLFFPPVLDQAFQAFAFLFGENLAALQEIERVDFLSSAKEEMWIVGEIVSQDEVQARGAFHLCDATGNVLLYASGIKWALSQPVNKNSRDQLCSKLKQLPFDARCAEISQNLVQIFSSVLQVVPENFDGSKCLGDLGIDSLMGFDVQMRVEELLNVDLPITMIKRETTISDIAAFMAEGIEGENQKSEVRMQK
jgi:acyl transferase domain-containing protein/acyl carrier protein